MRHIQRAGALAALGQAATYAVAIALFVGVLIPAGYGAEDPVRNVASVVENRVAVFALDVGVYVVSSVLQVVLVVALYWRLRDASPALAQVAAVFGIIWAAVLVASGMIASVGLSAVSDLYGADPDRAAGVWLAVEVVRDGLGGGTEIVGGVWILLLSLAALRSAALPRPLSLLGAVVGVAGVLSVLPALAGALTSVFGLGILAWFVWLGVVVLREGGGADGRGASGPATDREWEARRGARA